MCAILFCFILLYGNAQSQHKLVKIWETDSVLKVPESVIFDAKNKVLYSANIDGEPWGRDGKGSIGKIGLDGKIIASEWVTGLNAAKGMGIHNGKLYVADLDVIVVIDIAKGAITDRIAVAGAEGLNDVSIDRKGTIYVSDSKTKKIHQVKNGKSSIVIEDLKGPNGVLAVNDDLYLVDAGTFNKLENGKLKQIADGMEGGTDGIEHVGNGEFIISCWAGSVWYVYADGRKDHLLDTREQKINSADIGYDPVKKIVYIPTFFKNSVAAYQLQ
ncbi:MAG: ATP/GTP-binding protein [Chitinophagaceae bacterium]|nr:ATP/GTP-binding protein [Chitinophagaceae bacterium]MCW5925433.1 ATP/GTP-binding protein [Chitinophagaceae bacterium]